MYQDPKRVRTRYAVVRLDEYERRIIDALVDYTGMERAALVRQLLLKEAMETVGASGLNPSIGDAG